MVNKYVSTPFGEIVLIVDEGQLVYCNWNNEDCEGKMLAIQSKLSKEPLRKDNDILDTVSGEIEEYFSGRRKIFDLPLRLIGTDFQKKVWENILKIEYGSAMSYGDLSRLYGNPKAVRAVAGACGANPIAIIIPCHRVVGTNGRLGGYTGGIDKKIALLELENTLGNNNIK